ncbi:hypothetical protein M0R45_021887 [Rubus argutus]|uniref:RRM domain-containing protein n=1 Tax=Rubus argutus TaxID=59490 RepID=A0AAW1XFN0_RUBAR
MAFCNKVGRLLRQGISQNGQVPMASMFNSARYMSSKLFVGGLSFSTDDMSLKEAFSGFVDVTDARVLVDSWIGILGRLGDLDCSPTISFNGGYRGGDEGF